jgi:hypothetical protein
MDKIVSISSNNNPKYLYYIPLVKWAWEQFGWKTFVSFVGTETKASKFVEDIIDDFSWYLTENNYPSETVAQVCRMYASQEWPDDHLMMLSDSDMLPLSNYWQPYENTITCYGRDLSDEHQPMCYVAMKKEHWKTVMNGEENPGEQGIWWDLNHWYPKAKNKWTVDQNILTERITGFQKIQVHRGVDPKTHYPIGRVDRSNWRLDHERLIDCHLPHDVLTNEKSFHKVMELLHHVWPTENFKWFLDYHKEFKKLL